MTNFWMMARHWESAASPVRWHGRRPQPPWGWPSGQMKLWRPCTSSPSPVHPSCPDVMKPQDSGSSANEQAVQ
uniref:Uncharacterized protein n=1 Tax=Panthera tigris altaica TaxID=74533 RepID=A0A8C9J1I4_PANTA